jgi:hypothetical protein
MRVHGQKQEKKKKQRDLAEFTAKLLFVYFLIHVFSSKG